MAENAEPPAKQRRLGEVSTTPEPGVGGPAQVRLGAEEWQRRLERLVHLVPEANDAAVAAQVLEANDGHVGNAIPDLNALVGKSGEVICTGGCGKADCSVEYGETLVRGGRLWHAVWVLCNTDIDAACAHTCTRWRARAVARRFERMSRGGTNVFAKTRSTESTASGRLGFAHWHRSSRPC